MNSYYASQSRPGHRSNGSHSAPQAPPDFRDIFARELPETLSHSFKHGALNSPISLKPKISQKLRSLVSKFETLDTFNDEFKIPSLQPAPLQVSRNSTRRRAGTGASTGQGRLSTIFSPVTRSQIEAVRPAETASVHMPSDLYNTTKPKYPPSTSKTKRTPSKDEQNQCKGGRLLLRSGVEVPALPSPGRKADINAPMQNPVRTPTKEPSPNASSYGQGGSTGRKRGSSVKDRIRFFDGSLDCTPQCRPFQASSNSANASAKVAEAGIAEILTPSTPRSKVPARNTNVNSSILIVKSIDCATDMKSLTSAYSSQSSPLKKRNSTFMDSTQNPFLTQQGSGAKSSISGFSTVSPRSSPRPRRLRQSAADKDDSPIRGRRLLRGNASQICKESPAKLDTGPITSAASDQVLWNGKKIPVDPQRRHITEKIEALYRVRSQEQNFDRKEVNVPSPPEYQASITIPKTKPLDSKVDQKNQTLSVSRKELRIADMKARFDGARSFASAIPISKREEAKEVIKDADEHSLQSVPPSPLLPPVHTTKPLFTSLKGLHMKDSSIMSSVVLPQQSLIQPILELKQNRRARNNVIGDRIKLFEGIANDKGKTAVRANNKESNLSADITPKEFSERIAARQHRQETNIFKERGISGKEAKALVEQIQDMSPPAKGENKVGKKAIIGRLDGGSSGTLTPESTHETSTGLYDNGSKEMIVKEVECGIKQPKPLRLVEMKRMMLLCSGKGGMAMDKDKNNRVASQKIF